MRITMKMDNDELQDLIDSACYEELASEKEPELQTITLFTNDGKTIELASITHVEIEYVA